MQGGLRRVFLLAGILTLFALPAAARTGAGEHCAHDAAPRGGMHAAHGHEAAAVEEVPFGGAEPQAPCPQHTGQACKESMMLKCNMKTGCCIKSDGPLSTGLSNRPAADNDLALSDSPARPAVSRRANVTSCRWLLPQDRAEPDPRPPSA
ncbi:MAG: hypothetical protein HZA03_00630 [Nitrospinae bacterium]|nr:hypothetical protein [Nitrospinota bacterium]